MVFSRLFLLDGTQRHRQLSPRKYSVFQVYQIPVPLILPTFYVSCKANGCLYLVYANFLSWHDLSTSQLLFEDKPWIFGHLGFLVIHPPLKRFFVFSCHYFRVAPTTKNRELFCMPRLPMLCCDSHRNSWHSSTYRAVFEDEPGIFGNLSFPKKS